MNSVLSTTDKPASLKLWPYGIIQICLLLLLTSEFIGSSPFKLLTTDHKMDSIIAR